LHLLEGLILQLHEEIESGAPAHPADQAANMEPATIELQTSRATPESTDGGEASSDFREFVSDGDANHSEENATRPL
jgi:hypothetical protein